jgi:hypothetical protein
MNIIGGHKTEPTGKTMRQHPDNPPELRCTGCEATGDRYTFAVGVQGCPADPTSFPLWVCPGGDGCDGHMDTDSAEFRAWKDIPSYDAGNVPRWTHGTDDLAERAADAYRVRMDQVGMRTGVWSQEGFRVGREGGLVAELTFIGLSWSVWVDAGGHVTARIGS